MASRGRTCIIIAALAHIICWVLMTAFGMPVEPEVNSSLPTVSGVIFAIELPTSAVTFVAASSAKATLLMPSQGRSTWTTVMPVGSGRAVGAETMTAFAPRSLAASAIAKPCLPLDSFER